MLSHFGILFTNAVAMVNDDWPAVILITAVPASVGDVLESNICKALSIIGYKVKPDELQACHRLMKRDTDC